MSYSKIIFGKVLRKTAVFAATIMVLSPAVAQEQDESGFRREIGDLRNTVGRACLSWKDKGASCQKWLDGISQAANRPAATGQDRHDAIYFRMMAAGAYGRGLLNDNQPQRAVDEYSKAFRIMDEHGKSGHAHAYMDGFEIVVGLAKAAHEAGNVGFADSGYLKAREMVQGFARQLEEGGDRVPASTKDRIIQILLAGEHAEVEWANRLSERALRAALASNRQEAMRLWVSAGQAFGHASLNVSLADKAGAPRISREGIRAWMDHALVRIAGYDQRAGDQFLLAYDTGFDNDSLAAAKGLYEESLSFHARSEKELMGTDAGFRANMGESYLGAAGRFLVGAQIGLGEVLARQGKLGEASRYFDLAKEELSPKTRRQMSERAKQGRALKKWILEEASVVKKDVSECLDAKNPTQKYLKDKVVDEKEFCKASQAAVDALFEDTPLPRFADDDLNAARLVARLVTANARWMDGSWKEAEESWEWTHEVAAGPDRKKAVPDIDVFSLHQARGWAKKNAAP